MNKWIKGIPTTKGIYWFDNGLDLNIKREPFILQISSNKYIFGDGGSFPLDFVYDEKIKKHYSPKYMEIAQPNKWYSPQDILTGKVKLNKNSNGNYRAWVKELTEENEEYLGIGLLSGSYGTIVWLNNPHSASIVGANVNKPRFTLSPLKIPKISK